MAAADAPLSAAIVMTKNKKRGAVGAPRMQGRGLPLPWGNGRRSRYSGTSVETCTLL